MAEFQRPKQVFRFDFGGSNTRDVPDALAPTKYAATQNIRSTGSKSIRTRPGYVPLFVTGNNEITDVRSYTDLGTDNLPRFLARDSNGTIWLDTGHAVGNMTAPAGTGVVMLPFRPAESPQTWMYIAAANDYQKFQAPDANNNVASAKVGIAEPQQSLDACPLFAQFSIGNNANQDMTGNANKWVAAGNAGGLADGNRSIDALSGNGIPDPAYVIRNYCPMGNNGNSIYSAGEILSMNNEFPGVVLEDVIPGISGIGTIQAIRYTSGNNGKCVMALGQIPQSDDYIATVRHGSILQLHRSGLNENILVLDAIPGPNGQMAIETSTVNHWNANNATYTGVLSLALPNLAYPIAPVIPAGQSAHGFVITANLNTGVGTLTTLFGYNPFATPYFESGAYPQGDDYIHISLAMSDPSQLVNMLVMFSLNGNNYTGDVFYYAIQPGDLVSIVTGNNTTQLSAILQSAENELITQLDTPDNIPGPGYTTAGNNQFSEIFFNVSQLTRLGSDYSKTLADCSSMQMQFNVANNISIQFGSIWLGSGGQPDVGNNAAPYKYQAVPLASSTGVRGNPTAVMRYGVTPRRQSVRLLTSALTAAYDPQIDTWEINRYGGTVDSVRFIGTVPIGSDFVDNYYDDAATAGSLISIDNTEPWPSIGTPFNASNANWSFNVFGNQLVLSLTSGSPPQPQLVTQWLPGTLVQLGIISTGPPALGGLALGGEAFTLRYRPTVLSANNYLFVFEECIGSLAPTSMFVLESNIANQPLPYTWGPNAYGDFFGVGGALRPGVVQWAKSYQPDASPTKNTLDLCPPSEPLLGGATLGGSDIVASSSRWWSLYFQQGGTNRYQPVEIAVGRRLASPYGKCVYGGSLYFWATDCIAHTAGQAAVSLTDEDLFNLFPHGGILGKNIVRGPVTFYAPDYSRAAHFRLGVREGILYASYQDTDGNRRMLVGEIKAEGVAWSSDVYADAMSAVYAVEQPDGTLTNSPTSYAAVVMGTTSGSVVKLQDLTNDRGIGGIPIAATVYTLEWNAGDLRTDNLWGDQFVDLFAPMGLVATPVSQGVAVAGATSLPAISSRQFAPISMDGGVLKSFVGLILTWTDDFDQQLNPTTLHSWQPSFADKPETIQNRFGDWVDFGVASYVRGVIIHGNTFGANKSLAIRNADTNELITFEGGVGPGIFNHDGERNLPYYFDPPFVAHMVRDESQDSVPWQKFGEFEWIKDPWAELTNLPSPWMNLGTTKAKFLQGLVIPIDTNGPLLLEGTQLAFTAFQPHRTMYIGGTNRTGAMGAMVKAAPDGFTIQTIFRDQADFCKLMLFDADDYFGQWQTTKYLPNFDLNGCVLSFDVTYDGLFPLESLKFPSIHQTSITVTYSDDTASSTFSIQPHITKAIGSLAARATYTVTGGPASPGDVVELFYASVNWSFVAAGGEDNASVAAYFAAQINATNWVSIASVGLFAEAEGPTFTVYASIYGFVDTNGFSVVLNNEESFATLAPGSLMIINSVTYRVRSVESPTACTLTSSAGVQSDAPYVAPGNGADGNSVMLYTLHDSASLQITPSSTLHFTGGRACTSLSISLDFTAILGSSAAGKIRQLSMVFAPALNYNPDAAGFALLPYAATECSAVFSNWTVQNAPVLYVAGKGSVRSGSAPATYTGSGWSQVAGSYFNGFAKISSTTNDTVSVTYNCGATHNIYLGTSLFNNCGIVSVVIDGGTPFNVDCYLANPSADITRRLLASDIRSGTHTVTITVTGTKNASSTGVAFTFDYIDAAVLSNPVEVGFLSLARNAASDYDTQHGYQLPPARLYWLARMCGLTGDWEHYIGAFFWQNRIRFGGRFSSATVTFGGTFALGDVITVTIGGTPLSITVTAIGGPSDFALLFAAYINGVFVGASATAAANVLTVTLLSPINGFTITVAVTTSASGTATLAGDLALAAEGVWQLDTPGLNIAAQAWHQDMLAQMTDGQTMTIAFSQECAGSPDNPPTAVWRQRFLNGTPVETGTSLGTAGVGVITNVSGSGPWTITLPSHGYLTGYTVIVFIGETPVQRGSWTINVTNSDVFVTVAAIGSVTAPQAGDFAVISWQSDQLAFSATVANYIGAAHLAVANLYGNLQLTPQLEMGEILWWFFSSDKPLIQGIGGAIGDVINVQTSTPHGWSNNWTAIVPIFDTGNGNAVYHPNAFAITITGNNSFYLQGSNLGANFTQVAGSFASGGGMAFYDADTLAAANNALGRNLTAFYTQDDDPTVNNSADALFLSQRISAYQQMVQAPTLATYPDASYELLWPEDVNRPDAPYFNIGYPFPQGGRLNNFVNLPASWKQQANSGFQFFKTEALSWSASYNAQNESVAAINYSTQVLQWLPAQCRYLIAWFNGNCYWPYEYSVASPLGFNWVGFFAIDQMCLLSWLLPLSDAEVSGVNIEIISSDGDTITLPAVVTTAARKTAVPFSFDTPIIGHEFQVKPLQPLRYWPAEIQWIFEPTPERASTWKMQFSALGSKGYKTVPRIEFSYNCTAPATMTIDVQDGTAPSILNLPSTGGEVWRVMATLTANKGQLYRFSAYSPVPTMQIFQNDFIVHVCDWGRQGEERLYRNFGDEFGDGAKI